MQILYVVQMLMRQPRWRNVFWKARKSGDSVGGVIICRVQNLPVGLGAPVFDRLEADLAKAMLSLPATKGFEVGSGFSGTRLKGSEHNDLLRSVRVAYGLLPIDLVAFREGSVMVKNCIFGPLLSPLPPYCRSSRRSILRAMRRS